MKNGSIEKWFVIGTDTGVGKTVLCALLMRHFFRVGCTPGYCKPAQTGCESPRHSNADAAFIYRHVPELAGREPEESTPYCFAPARAPYFAARQQGARIELSEIDRRIARLATQYNPLIIEAAGGLLVPLCEGVNMADLLVRTGATPILAARPSLGTINHTLLTMEALAQRGCKARAVFFLDNDRHGTPDDLVLENAEAITAATGVYVGLIPYIDDFTCVPEEVFATLRAGLGRKAETSPAPASRPLEDECTGTRSGTLTPLHPLSQPAAQQRSLCPSLRPE